MAWDVLSGVAKTACDVFSGVTKLHGMFCPGWQIDVGCFVRGGKKWHGMFCLGYFVLHSNQTLGHGSGNQHIYIKNGVDSNRKPEYSKQTPIVDFFCKRVTIIASG